MQDLVNFFRRNPQALLLLLICLILGIGAFVAILIAVGTSPNHAGPGYPNGSITLLRSLGGALP